MGDIWYVDIVEHEPTNVAENRLGSVYHVKYDHPAVVDSWMGLVVGVQERTEMWEFLVLDDPLDEFQGRSKVYASESFLLRCKAQRVP